MKKLLSIIFLLISISSFAQQKTVIKVQGTPGVYNISKVGDSIIYYVAGVRYAIGVGTVTDLTNYYKKNQTDSVTNIWNTLPLASTWTPIGNTFDSVGIQRQPDIIKQDSTYYIFTEYLPDSNHLENVWHIGVYSSNSITGPWSFVTDILTPSTGLKVMPFPVNQERFMR
jgi:hypothetical protein